MFMGNVLREEREKAGYTLIGLAKALNEKYGVLVVDYTTLSQWEIAKNANPRRKNVEKVAKFLNIPIEKLYDEAMAIPEKKEDILDTLEKIIKLYKTDPNDDRIARIKEIIM